MDRGVACCRCAVSVVIDEASGHITTGNIEF